MSTITRPATSRFSPRAAATALAAAGLMALAGPAAAETFSVEGPLQEVNYTYGATSGTVRCNGSTIVVTAATVITSPTATLTLAQLADPAPFVKSGYSPFTGAYRQGFVGGTCIIDGDDATGQRVADTVFVEVAENVLVGATTNAPGTPFAIAGVEVRPTWDERMPATQPAAGMYRINGTHLSEEVGAPAFTREFARNQFGFGVDLATVPPGDVSSAEGYAGTDGALYAHSIETSGGSALNPSLLRASIQRAQCRNEAGTARDQVEVLGGCVLPPGVTAGVVTIFTRNGAGNAAPLVVNTGTVAGAVATVTCTADPLFPGFGAYRFRSDRARLPGNACPAQLGAQLNQQGVPAANGLFDFANTDAR